MSLGLYQPNEFKDNCGFGLMAHTKGRYSHSLLTKAIGALTCMTHRGGIAADGKTGDGCGLLMQKPDSFLRSVAKEEIGVELPDLYAVGFIMFNVDPNQRDRARAIFESELSRQNLKVAGWRKVPTNNDCLGEIALRSLPCLEQVFVISDRDEVTFRARLFIARRKTEKQLEDDDSFYIASLSSAVLVYKGLMMPADLPRFYPDLADRRLETGICVFHQRFSTNTMPKWPLAQPFRLLAHNGEINTIVGNRNWSVARTPKFVTPLIPDLEQATPLVNCSGSDSSSLDNMLEVLVTGGLDLHQAIRMLIPPAWNNVADRLTEHRAYYQFMSMHIEPWDGPAGLVLTDGRYAVCTLDRNGLRPSRWTLTDDDILTVASETGVCDADAQEIVAKGRLGPGDILSVDTLEGVVRHRREIEDMLSARRPYKQWLRAGITPIESSMEQDSLEVEGRMEPEQLRTYMKMYHLSLEERERMIRPLAENGQEPTASMGDDTPVAVLSTGQRNLFDYFRQQFAQVTNPAIDPLRESIVMSLATSLGKERNVFEETPDHAKRLHLTNPVLSPRKYFSLKYNDLPDYPLQKFSLQYRAGMESLEDAIRRVCDEVVAAVRSGVVLIVLSDHKIAQDSLPIHILLAIGAVHHRLIDEGLRCDANIIASTAYARDSHQIATLIGYGASAVYPYLSYHVIYDLVESGKLKCEVDTAFRNYRKGINKGLLKIISKMGISTIGSYRGAQLFEIVGLDQAVVDLCFVGTPNRIMGARFEDLEGDQLSLAADAWQQQKPIDPGGVIKYVHGREYHAFNPDVVKFLHGAVRSGDYGDWLKYAAVVNQRPVTSLRDLLAIRPAIEPVSLGETESVAKIVSRFESAGMSLGALSPEAHEALAEAMNRLGGRSNSGEGGEDIARYGSVRESKIKQIASGRFGVTPFYLVNAEVLQIKIAQGSKPGEGGQLPGNKVNKMIARLRHSIPGVTLISPPPHHDIYSIEDLAQLIYDLKQINPRALVSVKLVSCPGVGTIAAGVAKAYADLITISGHDGGTGASALTSIRYAGSPWELGLAETHQTLRANDLRDRVRIQVDGGLKTGLDVVKAAILGAESFGFGTAPMMALGCKYLRICHLNNCATGVATQDSRLREKHYSGTVEMAINFFRLLAEETREWMARLGVRSLDELIGRVDLLEVLPGETARQRNLDLSAILHEDERLTARPRFCQIRSNDPPDHGELAEKMIRDILPAIESGRGGLFEYRITIRDRSIGARLSGEIARRYGNRGMPRKPVILRLKGVAGQSLGVWNSAGLEIYLDGDANDYVGKGMAGGRIVLTPPANGRFEARQTPIMGNTCLYGATGGKLFASGLAGERFAVRNSGAMAVVEGAGDHCCEYMTGGVVAILGSTGHNFGAGMTGGFAYVLDLEAGFVDRINTELVEMQRISSESLESHRNFLQGMIREFAAETGSQWGRELLDNFGDYVARFWLVKRREANLASLLEHVYPFQHETIKTLELPG